MSANGVYCRWCGTFMSGEGQYCPSCGREREESKSVGTSNAHSRGTASTNTSKDTATGIFTRLAEGVGGIIAMVLALIVALVGTALPIFIVLALFMGPGDTWDMVSQWIPGGGNNNAACEGFDDWYDESAIRSQQIIVMMEDYDAGSTANTASILSMARETDALAAEQRRSTPPDEAVALNGMMVETFEVSADALRAVADGDQSLLQSLMLEAEQLTVEFDAEEKRLFDVCG